MQPPTQGGGRKRQNLTLDLNSASAKKNRVQNLLTSPDVQMLKLTSPELEKFLSLRDLILHTFSYWNFLDIFGLVSILKSHDFLVYGLHFCFSAGMARIFLKDSQWRLGVTSQTSENTFLGIL